MTYQEAIMTIINLNKQADAIIILASNLDNTMKKIDKENAEMSACLRAVKKINQGKNKAIDALCEREG